MNLNKTIQKKRLERHKKRRKGKPWNDDLPEVHSAKEVVRQMDKAIKIHTGKLEQANRIKKANEKLIKENS